MLKAARAFSTLLGLCIAPSAYAASAGIDTPVGMSDLPIAVEGNVIIDVKPSGATVTGSEEVSGTLKASGLDTSSGASDLPVAVQGNTILDVKPSGVSVTGSEQVSGSEQITGSEQVGGTVQSSGLDTAASVSDLPIGVQGTHIIDVNSSGVSITGTEQVSGSVQTSGSLQVGSDTGTCGGGQGEGKLQYTGGQLKVCNGQVWVALTLPRNVHAVWTEAPIAVCEVYTDNNGTPHGITYKNSPSGYSVESDIPGMATTVVNYMGGQTVGGAGTPFTNVWLYTTVCAATPYGLSASTYYIASNNGLDAAGDIGQSNWSALVPWSPN